MPSEFCALYSFAESGVSAKIDLFHKKAKDKCVPLLFLDSGAFTAANQGTEINIDDYIQFIYDKIDKITVYANLDVISNPRDTAENQYVMESSGLKPLPVFHMGTHMGILSEMAEKYAYVCLGGPGRNSSDLHFEWSKLCFREALRLNSKIKIHGFGITTTKAMEELPYYSVDSTSWICRRYGDVRIYHPIHDTIYFFHRVRPKDIAQNYRLLRETLKFYGLKADEFIQRRNVWKYMLASLKSYHNYALSLRKRKKIKFRIYFAAVEQKMLLKSDFFEYILGPYNIGLKSWGAK